MTNAIDRWPLGLDPIMLRASHTVGQPPDAPSGTSDPPGSDVALKHASEQFEALLLNMLLKEMRATIPESALWPESMAHSLFTGMLDERIADSISRAGGIGLARMLFDQLSTSGSPSEPR